MMIKTLFQKTLLILLPALLSAKHNHAQGIQKYTNNLFIEYGFVQYNNSGSEWLGENNNLLSFGLGYNKDVFSFLSIGLKAKHYTMAALPGTNTLSSNTAQLQLRVQRPRISRSFRLRRFSPYFETGFGQAIEYVNQNVEKHTAEYVYVPLIAGVDYNFSNHWALGVQGEYRLSGKDFDAVTGDVEHSLNHFNSVSARLSFYFGRNRKRPTAPRIYTRATSDRTTDVPETSTGGLQRAGLVQAANMDTHAVTEAVVMQMQSAAQKVVPAPQATMKITDTVLMQIVNPAAVTDSAIPVQVPAQQLAVPDTVSRKESNTALKDPALLNLKDTLPELRQDTVRLLKIDQSVRDTVQLINDAAPVLKQDMAALVLSDIQTRDMLPLIENKVVPALKQDTTTLMATNTLPDHTVDSIPPVKKDVMILVKGDTMTEPKKNPVNNIQKDTLNRSNTGGLKNRDTLSAMEKDTVILVQKDTVVRFKRDTVVLRKTDTIATRRRDTVLLHVRDTVRVNGYAVPAERNTPIDPVVKTDVVQTYTPMPIPAGKRTAPPADDGWNQLMEQKVNQLEVQNADLQSRLRQSEARNAIIPPGRTPAAVLPDAKNRSLTRETVAPAALLPILPQPGKTNTNLVVLPIGTGGAKKSTGNTSKTEQRLVNERQDSIFNRLSLIQAKLESLQGQPTVVPVLENNSGANKQAKMRQDSLNRGLQEQIKKLQQENEALQQQIGSNDTTIIVSNDSNEVKPVEEDLYFKVNQHKLDPELMRRLSILSDTLKNGPVQWILLEGFTDKSGSAAYNLELSGRRVQSVKAFLVKQGIPKEMILEKTFGSRFSTGMTNSNDRKVRLTQIAR